MEGRSEVWCFGVVFNICNHYRLFILLLIFKSVYIHTHISLSGEQNTVVPTEITIWSQSIMCIKALSWFSCVNGSSTRPLASFAALQRMMTKRTAATCEVQINIPPVRCQQQFEV